MQSVETNEGRDLAPERTFDRDAGTSELKKKTRGGRQSGTFVCIR